MTISDNYYNSSFGATNATENVIVTCSSSIEMQEEDKLPSLSIDKKPSFKSIKLKVSSFESFKKTSLVTSISHNTNEEDTIEDNDNDNHSSPSIYSSSLKIFE